ncbi:hypothetical protein GCM10011529_04160 [Polymorphobacter glacialis]|uniref:DUF502 domain-containing protein n=1 Tax=Sandarakinorhabdus glacialis TaxID=1614636 RepID=A0A916ZKJ0_9SPHN|nr:DUF502 domain-containing protein [Polymorphobacter glacialis]GGE01046.1 hypothetical protein GCM10011529_04160 [Polymorphobacter glacialis]
MMRRLVGPFVTGLVFLAPVILTILILQWLSGYVTAAFGPGTMIGEALANAGMLVTESRLMAFWSGIGLVVLIVWALGLLVQTQARARLEGGLDGLMGRMPLLGAFYRPLAQMVRMMGGTPGGELQGMAVVSVQLGDDTEVLSLLATPQIFDMGDGPRHLVLLPTAPVPIGGALLFVDVARVRRVPGLGVDDLAKFYVSMGTIAPEGLIRR